jgi:hypothetical protein
MARLIGIEMLRALCVLALICLSFNHAPLAAGAGPDILTASVDSSYCGDNPADSKPHAPCHACRFDGATLPPPCDIAIPVVQVADFSYGSLPVLVPPRTSTGPLGARAPPTLV